ncbi:MAG: aminopeptidase [Bacteroidales bacterium]|nr:aminopeptidase [Bacteroidales bacterium]
MKRILTIICAASLGIASFAQTQTIYKMTPVNDIKVTSVKNQASTGTCWCFATVSFLEAELLRQGKGEYDLSEMFVVRGNYKDRLFDNYLRRGNGNLGQGSIAHMATNAIAKYGIVPESVYDGIEYNSDRHNHGELNAYLNGIAEVSLKLRKQSPEYNKLMDSLFDIYLGKVPETFNYGGKTYTPSSFAASLGLDNLDDYVEITSYSHHPFYTQISLEIPDNWDHGLQYNVPLADFMDIIDNALKNGYTVAWDGDVSTKEFNHNKGIAICPEPKDLEEAVKLEKRFPERVVTQEVRQTAFETFDTTDDHLMHLTGLFKDQDGNYFYKTKNSWGPDRNPEMGGYLYMSRSYIALRGISFMVHKDAIPAAIRQKMGL